MQYNIYKHKLFTIHTLEACSHRHGGYITYMPAMMYTNVPSNIGFYELVIIIITCMQ